MMWIFNFHLENCFLKKNQTAAMLLLQMSRLILAPLGWKSNVCIFVTFLSLSLSLSRSHTFTHIHTHKQHIYCFWFLYPFPSFLVFDFFTFFFRLTLLCYLTISCRSISIYVSLSLYRSFCCTHKKVGSRTTINILRELKYTELANNRLVVIQIKNFSFVRPATCRMPILFLHDLLNRKKTGFGLKVFICWNLQIRDKIIVNCYATAKVEIIIRNFWFYWFH